MISDELRCQGGGNWRGFKRWEEIGLACDTWRGGEDTCDGEEDGVVTRVNDELAVLGRAGSMLNSVLIYDISSL